MFTGLVQDVARLQSVERRPGPSLSVWISTDLPLSALSLGASVACNGVCLTVVESFEEGNKRVFKADIGPQTLERSTFGHKVPGDPINVEPSLRMGDALGGHMVTGHVDGTATVVTNEEQGGGFWCLTLLLPPGFGQWVFPQGSLSVAGVSLTVVSKESAETPGFVVSFMLVPHTLAHTTLGALSVGEKVEVECDTQVKAVCATLHHVLPSFIAQGGL